MFFAVSNGAVSEPTGMLLGMALVLTYTVFGGMFSVAILDFVQMIVMLGGLLFVAFLVAGKVEGGAPAVIDAASVAGKFQFFPEADPWLWLTFIGTAVTMMFGSIPQQDVFQRVSSAKSARVALWGSVIGAALYFVFTFVPMFIAYSATLIDPAQFGAMVAEEGELIIPKLVMEHTPLFAQVAFYGAILSAIMSTASATLLAPSVTFAENVVKGYFPKMTDRQNLLTMRICLVIFSGSVLLFALNSESSIFKMVENAYKITLAGAFVPLVAGILWPRATTQGALCSIFGGLLAWILVEILIGEASLVPPQLIGLGVSVVGMVMGSYLPQWISPQERGTPMEALHAVSGSHPLGRR